MIKNKFYSHRKTEATSHIDSLEEAYKKTTNLHQNAIVDLDTAQEAVDALNREKKARGKSVISKLNKTLNGKPSKRIELENTLLQAKLTVRDTLENKSEAKHRLADAQRGQEDFVRRETESRALKKRHLEEEKLRRRAAEELQAARAFLAAEQLRLVAEEKSRVRREEKFAARQAEERRRLSAERLEAHAFLEEAARSAAQARNLAREAGAAAKTALEASATAVKASTQSAQPQLAPKTPAPQAVVATPQPAAKVSPALSL